MNDFNRTVGMQSEMDLGLRSFMTGTYKYMAMAMAVSAAVAYMVGQYIVANPQVMAIFRNPMVMIGFVIAIPVAFGIVGRKMNTMSLGAVRIFLFGFAAMMGAWLAPIAAMASEMAGMGAVTLKIFFMAVAVFASLSMFGYVTKKDLSGIAKVAFMVFVGGVVFLLLSAVFPSMAPSGTLDIVINIGMLIAISVITAWETQALKQVYYATVGNPEMAEKYSVVGAASLLLSFINIFILLFNLLGNE